MIEYIRKEWNSTVSDIKKMKKRQFLGSAVNLGAARLDLLLDQQCPASKKQTHTPLLLQGWW